MKQLFVDSDIARAKTISTDFYLKEAYLEAAKEKIFSNSWQFIGDEDQLVDESCALPITLLENYIHEPLILVKDGKGKIHCLSNVCTHRGNLLVEQYCTSKDIRCKYHGRRFKLDGTFSSMPEFNGVEDFPTKDDNLTSLPLHRWGKWLFTSLNNELQPEKFFEQIIERVGWMPIESFRFRADLSKDYLVTSNWALYCENYLEGFHIPFVHPELNSVIDFSNYSIELNELSSLQIGIAKANELAFDLPKSSVDFGKRIGGYYFWVFPNLMFNFYPWGASINIVQPMGVDKCKVSFRSYVWDESKLSAGAGGDIHKVEIQDEDIVQNVQKGIRSRFYKHGRYSVKQEKGTHHFHRLICDYINK
ncbi:MAG: aromatic ring-hydroxylating dioxygenase subunit alpha [Cyclobacteriaceae bacterium]